ncbi:MAG TPA: FtsK/SpoIIIE domain-containing protein [Jatrophihabitans sp.]|nr:FtsK/SpoIIIE domain-containing protein [Jatrophihabitans sp.]
MQVAFTLSDGNGRSVDVAVHSVRPVILHDVLERFPDLTGEAGQFQECDGQLLSGHALVGASPLRTGSTVTVGAATRRRTVGSAMTLEVTSGPDCGGSIPLVRGRTVIGRSAEVDVHIDDPDLSRRHLELVVGAHSIHLRDLGSTNGIRVDGVPVEPGQHVPLRPASIVSAGNSLLQIREPSDPPIGLVETGDGLLRLERAAQNRQQWRPGRHVLPVPPAPQERARPNVLVTLLPLGASLTLAGTAHASGFLLLATMSPALMLLATLRDHRARSRRGAAEQQQFERISEAVRVQIGCSLQEESDHRRHSAPDAATVARAALTPDRRLWERRTDHPDFLRIRLGVAEQAAETVLADQGSDRSAGLLSDLPATVRLTEHPLCLAGPEAALDGLARWAVAQLAVLQSPTEVRFTLLLRRSRSRSWRWLRWIPALDEVAHSAEERNRVAERLRHLFAARQAEARGTGAWTGSWLIVIVDPVRLIAELPGLDEVIRRGTEVGITALCVHTGGPPSRSVDGACTVRYADETATTLSVTSPASGLAPVTAERVSAAWAERIGRALAPLREQPDSSDEPLGVPQLLGLDPLSADVVRRAWHTAPDRPGVPLGLGADGAFHLDLPQDGPHLLIAGTTGSGKSELLRSLIAGHALRYPPSALSFVLIDYKGGAAFAECATLPHVVGLVTDLDPHLTQRALISLNAELQRRERLFSQAGVTDLAEYHAAPEQRRAGLSRLVLIIDEFATLAEELPEFLGGLLNIAQRGRSLGMHLVLATQRPAGVLSPAIRANIGMRICLRVTDAADSLDVIGSPDAASIDSRSAGHAIARHSNGHLETFRSGYVSRLARGPVSVSVLDDWNRPRSADRAAAGPTELQLIHSATRSAAAGIDPVPRPWLDPLPELVVMSPVIDSKVVNFGMTDLPAEQRRGVLRVDLSEPEPVALIGGPRSGRTTALCTVLGLAAAQRSAAQLHLYLMDFSGGYLHAFRDVPHCGACLDADDPAAVARLVERLLAEASHRRAQRSRASGRRFEPAPDQPTMLVALDGWEQFATRSAEIDGGRTAEGFLRLLKEGPGAGIVVLLTGDRRLLTGPVRSAVSRMLVLPLADPEDYAVAGVGRRSIPAGYPGRVVDARSGVEGQVGTVTEGAAGDELRDWIARNVAVSNSHGTGPSLRIRSLPLVAPAPRGARTTAGGTETYLLGVGGDEAGPVSWTPPRHGTRLLVAGPRRSGRTETLLRIAEQACPTRRIVVAATVGSALSRWAAGHGVSSLDAGDDAPDEIDADVMLVDDAERYTGTPVGDLLHSWLRSGTGTAVVATSSSDLATDFRGLAAELRKHRAALLLQPTPADAATFGVELPLLRPATIPGRGILIADGLTGPRDYLPIQVTG